MANGNVETRPMNLPNSYLEFYPKPYLRNHDLNGQSWNMTIKEIVQAKLYDPDQKREAWRPVIKFEGAKRFLIMTEVITRQIGEALGMEDPAKWIGQVVCLYPEEERHAGRTWPVIRIRKADPNARTPAADQNQAAG